MSKFMFCLLSDSFVAASRVLLDRETPMSKHPFVPPSRGLSFLDNALNHLWMYCFFSHRISLLLSTFGDARAQNASYTIKCQFIKCNYRVITTGKSPPSLLSYWTERETIMTKWSSLHAICILIMSHDSTLWAHMCVPCHYAQSFCGPILGEELMHTL